MSRILSVSGARPAFFRPSIAVGVALAALATAMAPSAHAQSSPWVFRARAVNIDPAEKDHTGLGLSLSRKTIPEVDFSYFMAPNWAAELVLTVPQRHKLYSNGQRIGSVKHLPPTLTLQYHFNPEGGFRPYLGAGLNYTRFSGVHFEPAVQAALEPTITKNSVGLAAQAGFDVMLDKQWSINVDVKKIQMDTEVRSKGTNVGKFKIDPLLVGVGVGYRF
ncbi:OmpW family outer membrane protein [Mitsuaria sp. CC2]|jgi:outer membrane protein|uniref:OmpW/AlkL family protein n=1 Tax=Mitsuaria sp. CC2 TaxID=3029186 RepID=UPI003B8CDEC4